MPDSVKQRFIQTITARFADLKTQNLDMLVSENLLSPFKVPLKKEFLGQAQKFIAAAFKLRSSPSYLEHYSLQTKELGLIDPGNKSILMSYDFHVVGDELKLIEVNTNASFLALGLMMYASQGQPLPFPDFSEDELKQNILHELSLQNKSTLPNLNVAIVDEDPKSQRLFAEFLVYQQMFQKWGWNCEILDVEQLKNSFDFIYNRSTDFYFTSEKSKHLKQLFLSKKSCLSPNPFEYFLLADKQRLIDWSSPGFLENFLTSDELSNLKSGLGESYSITKDNAEEIWSIKKQLFFKPQRAFGAKQSYKGASISRKYFDEMIDQGFIAQTYFPADEKVFATPAGEQSFKYDLRVYAYQDKAQFVVARLYQGQVTNLKTPYGGFACIEVQ